MFPFASLIYNENVYFGGYPNKECFNILVKNGTKIFIDLTNSIEKQNHQLYDYVSLDIHTNPNIKYYSFPIEDNHIPSDIPKFKDFVLFLSNKILELFSNEKIYIHCKGGHGRSGMLSACILCYLLNIIPEQALYMTTIAHSKRQILKSRWKNVRCPQTFCQRKFVIDVFKPIIITPTLYIDKISNKISDFLVQTHIRPIKENDDSEYQILCNILYHFRKIINRSQSTTSSILYCF